MRYDAVDDDMVRRNRSDREALDRVTLKHAHFVLCQRQSKEGENREAMVFPFVRYVDWYARCPSGFTTTNSDPMSSLSLWPQIEYFAVHPPLRVPPERPTLPLLLLLLLRLRPTPHRLILCRDCRLGTGAEGSDQQAVTGPVYSKRARMHS